MWRRSASPHSEELHRLISVSSPTPGGKRPKLEKKAPRFGKPKKKQQQQPQAHCMAHAERSHRSAPVIDKRPRCPQCDLENAPANERWIKQEKESEEGKQQQQRRGFCSLASYEAHLHENRSDPRPRCFGRVFGAERWGHSWSGYTPGPVIAKSQLRPVCPVRPIGRFVWYERQPRMDSFFLLLSPFLLGCVVAGRNLSLFFAPFQVVRNPTYDGPRGNLME